MPIESNKELVDQVDDLGNILVNARVSYDIWWHYRHKETREQNLDTMREYEVFFAYDTYANFTSFVVHIYMLFDKSKGVVSFPKIKEGLKKSNHLSAEKSKEFDELLRKAEKVAKKIKILRDNVFAHRSKLKTPEQAYSEVNLTPDEMLSLTDDAIGLLDLLRYALNTGTIEFREWELKPAIERLFEKLKQS